MLDFSFSVVIITYNQQAYISQAIESVLSQDLSFVKEIIISDDGSTDKTLKIAECYQEKYPIIKIISAPHDVDERYSKIPACNHLRIRDNYIRAVSACEGDYIAFLEGDDYWLPGKLEYFSTLFNSQAFDPKNFSFFFHKYNIFKNGQIESRFYKHNSEAEIDIHENIREYEVQNLSSAIYDAEILKSVLVDFANVTGVDYSLNILCLQKRNAYFVPNTFSVYRISEKGVWSRLSEEEKEIRNIDGRLKLNSFFENKYHDDFYYGIDEAIKRYINIRGGRANFCNGLDILLAITQSFKKSMPNCKLNLTTKKVGLSNFCKANEISNQNYRKNGNSLNG